jgi:hypothetical protein
MLSATSFMPPSTGSGIQSSKIKDWNQIDSEEPEQIVRTKRLF